MSSLPHSWFKWLSLFEYSLVRDKNQIVESLFFKTSIEQIQKLIWLISSSNTSPKLNRNREDCFKKVLLFLDLFSKNKIQLILDDGLIFWQIFNNTIRQEQKITKVHDHDQLAAVCFYFRKHFLWFHHLVNFLLIPACLWPVWLFF